MDESKSKETLEIILEKLIEISSDLNEIHSSIDFDFDNLNSIMRDGFERIHSRLTEMEKSQNQ